MRRPQPAGRDQQVGLETFLERRRQFLRSVPDHDDPRRLEPARRQLAREKGPVGVLTPAPRQLAAGDDDRCSGAQLGFGATVTPLGVTSNQRCPPVPRPGTATDWPFSFSRRLAGAKT